VQAVSRGWLANVCEDGGVDTRADEHHEADEDGLRPRDRAHLQHTEGTRRRVHSARRRRVRRELGCSGERAEAMALCVSRSVNIVAHGMIV
jgi:hypothetical protein